MPRKQERVQIERIERYVKRFGPLTSRQIRQAFGIADGGLSSKIGKSLHLKWVGTHNSGHWIYMI